MAQSSISVNLRGISLSFQMGIKFTMRVTQMCSVICGIIGELYQPDLALLPIGDHFTMGPREAAYAAQLLNVPAIVPIHYGTFPLLTGTPDALRELTKDQGVEIVALQPGETLD